MSNTDLIGLVWKVAESLRGAYRPNQYKDVMLPMTVLRRLDCVLKPTKDKVLAKKKKMSSKPFKALDRILCRDSGLPFYNSNLCTFELKFDTVSETPGVDRMKHNEESTGKFLNDGAAGKALSTHLLRGVRAVARGGAGVGARPGWSRPPLRMGRTHRASDGLELQSCATIAPAMGAQGALCPSAPHPEAAAIAPATAAQGAGARTKTSTVCVPMRHPRARSDNGAD